MLSWLIGFLFGQTFGFFSGYLVNGFAYCLGGLGFLFVVVCQGPYLKKLIPLIFIFGFFWGASNNAPSPSTELGIVSLIRTGNFMSAPTHIFIESGSETFLASGKSRDKLYGTISLELKSDLFRPVQARFNGTVGNLKKSHELGWRERFVAFLKDLFPQ